MVGGIWESWLTTEVGITIVEGVDMIREMFEKWFKEYYAHHLDKEEYSLERFDSHPYPYIQDIAHHDWKVWRECSSSILSIVREVAE